MDKETKDRIAERNKEEIKILTEYFRVGIFFLATVGSGTLAITFKKEQSITEQIAAITGFIFYNFRPISYTSFK
jgi:hypothetical protein